MKTRWKKADWWRFARKVCHWLKMWGMAFILCAVGIGIVIGVIVKWIELWEWVAQQFGWDEQIAVIAGIVVFVSGVIAVCFAFSREAEGEC